MEKLIELLNEWQQSFNPGYEFTYKYNKESARKDLNNLSQLKLFIKWLVENDKIDFQIWNGEKYLEYPIGSDNYDGVEDYKDIIQWLSISDTPIEDLLLYLK